MGNEKTIKITGMSCAACAIRIEKGLSRINGVEKASVNLALETASIKYDPAAVDLSFISSVISNLGYGVIDKDEVEDDVRRLELKKLGIMVAASAALSLPLLLSMIGMMLSAGPHFLHDPWFQLVLATPVQFIIGYRFYRNAYHGLRSGSPGMDLLVAVGTTAAYFLSLYNGIIRPWLSGTSGGIYFEASSAVITLVLLGKYLEAVSKGRTSEAVKKLAGLRPGTAAVVVDGMEVSVPVNMLKPGDEISVKPGESLPADGVIISGYSSVDEGMITGESMPADRGPGDGVTGGTVNLHGSFVFRAVKTGADTYLASVIRIVEEAQNSKSPVQRLADRLAGIFVPGVMIIAVLTFIAWILISGDLERAILGAVAVLVIACPCALGLATPTAMIAGMGRGAEIGILIKRAEALETASMIDMVVLDKTGTVTFGRPALTGIRTMGTDEKYLMFFAGIAEKRSEHPVGRAIYDKAASIAGEIPDPQSFIAVPGGGVDAFYEGKRILVGNRAFVADGGADPSLFEKDLAVLENDGKTSVVVCVDAEPIGILSVSDVIRDTSARAVEEIRRLGCEVVMITGDNERVAASVAKAIGINSFIAGVRPDKKAAEIRRMKAGGRKVAMVGDGINDAPALAEADLGIAIGTGTDIARETSDIIIVNGDPLEITDALRLSRRLFRKIRQNLFWAFIYNIVGIPFAALGLLSPVIAGAAMSMSSVSVVLNSLSIKGFKKKA
ncbi:MAG: heavy metal translocating P-type ATPase [Spirochaetes bacterium]|nr:heavy metal translocating P-type ATPase [Spirochaetota bacterium]